MNEHLDPNVFGLIISYLDSNDLNALCVCDSKIPRKVALSLKTSTYWHQKTELLLQRVLNFRQIDWCDTYKIIAILSSRRQYCYTDAAKGGYSDVIKILLEAKYPDKTIDNCDISRAFVQIVRYGYTDLVEILLKDGRANPSHGDNAAIIYAVCNGHVAIVKLLLSDSRVDPSARYNEAINDAILDPYKRNILKILLKDKRVDPSDRRNAAIISACSIRGNSEIVKILLADPRVDPSDQKNKAIQSAAIIHNTSIIKLLLNDKRVDPSAMNNEAIILASLDNNSYDTIKLLMQDKRINPSARNNKCIINASENGELESVKLLLTDKRVDPSVLNNRAITLASRNRNYTTVDRLSEDLRVEYTISNVNSIRLEVMHDPSFVMTRISKSKHNLTQRNSYLHKSSQVAANFCFPTKAFRFKTGIQYQTEPTESAVTKRTSNRSITYFYQEIPKLGITKYFNIRTDD